MSDDEKRENVVQIKPSDKKPKIFKLWHERIESSKINKMATDLVRRFMSMGIRIDTINVYWDDNGKFITRTKGKHLDRRIEDKKTPPHD